MRSFTILFILSLLTLSCNEEPVQEPPINYDNLQLPERPNILWLVAEDLSAFIPPFGDSTVATPNLSRLAREGVRYTHFFSPSPVCAPARSAIATGMYPTRIGAMHMRTGPWFTFGIRDEIVNSQPRPSYEALPPPEVQMHSTYLRKNGYYCSNNWKEDYQFRVEMTAWDESSRQAHWRNREPGQPFFSIFNFMVTHESRLWIKEKDSLWVDEDLEVPVPPYFPDTEVTRANLRRMYSNIKEMDFQVGEILDQLEEDGLLDNTIIFWYTDHGGPVPRHKRTIYDTGLHAPLIIRFPDQQLAGQVDSQLLSFIDLKPTLLSLAGIAPPDYVDGQAWLGEYAGESPRQYIHAAADRFDNQHDRIRAVRDRRFKYIRNYIPEQSYYLPVKYREEIPIMKELLRLREAGQLNEIQSLWFREPKDPEELFDTYADPFELNNLAGDPQYADKLKELGQEMDRWIAQTNDLGMMPEEEYIEQIWPGGRQAVTAAPQIEKQGDQWIISCETEGAAIGYQWLEEGEEPGPSWEIYQGPINDVPGKRLVARAHRIGYRPSSAKEKSLGSSID